MSSILTLGTYLLHHHVKHACTDYRLVRMLLISCNFFTSDKGVGKYDCPRCLSVCLLAITLLKNACMDLDDILRVDTRQSEHGRTDQLLSPIIRIIARVPEPDCFLRYRMSCNTEFYYMVKIPRIGICRPTATCGFIHCELWEQLCRRFMCSAWCPSS